ncbi:MAG: hypothetical protein IT198_17700 [Acidimicrobiia bacterium]|nr:hypothetical protein [Acidimicrobiia bacterium]
MTESVRLRAAARFLAACPLGRRLDACRRFGVERDLDVDPLGRHLSSHRTRDGLREIETTVPVGVVGLVDPTHDEMADCLLGGSVMAVEGQDVDDVRAALGAAGLVADCVIPVSSLEGVELDALHVAGDTHVAARTGTHSHIYIDASADTGHTSYIVVNAAAHDVTDTVVFHADFSRAGVNDVVRSLEHIGKEMTLVRARTLGEAVDVVDRRTSGEVECILTDSIRILRDFRTRLDSAVLAVNASPAFAPEGGYSRTLDGFVRSRLLIEGSGQTKSLG